MSLQSHRLRNGDVRNVFRLLGEITELGRDPVRWRTHMLERFLPLIGGRVGLVGEHFISPVDPSDTTYAGMVDHGFLPAERAIFYDYLQTGAFARDPFHEVVPPLIFRSFTRRRSDFISDDVWYASPLVSDVRRRCNVDDTIHCRCRLPHAGWAQFMSLMRDWGEKRFGVRERLMVSLLNRELGRLWSQVEVAPLTALPPRLRQTLDLIFSGYSEKEMAKTLNVSVHTLHDFARRLYRHFGVDSRTRLLTNPACRRVLLRPALSPVYYLHDRRTAENVPRATASAAT